MKTSEAVADLFAALAKSQAEMHNPGFDRDNPHFKSKYSSLAAVRDAIVPQLAKHGIAVLQEPTLGQGGVSCITRLVHQSGQWLETEPYFVPTDKMSAQGVASATTYARRIALQSLLVVAGDRDEDDDDGNAAEAAYHRQQHPPAQRSQSAGHGHTPPSAPAANGHKNGNGEPHLPTGPTNLLGIAEAEKVVTVIRQSATQETLEAIPDQHIKGKQWQQSALNYIRKEYSLRQQQLNEGIEIPY